MKDSIELAEKPAREFAQKLRAHFYKAISAYVDSREKLFTPKGEKILEGLAYGMYRKAIHSTNTSLLADFAKAILHGDEAHRAWLLAAAEAFSNGRPLPEPTGSNGTSLLEENKRLREALDIFVRASKFTGFHRAGDNPVVDHFTVNLSPTDHLKINQALSQEHTEVDPSPSISEVEPWLPVESLAPEDDVLLGHQETEYVTVGYAMEESMFWDYLEDGKRLPGTFTHYMPLPKPPVEALPPVKGGG